MNLLATRPADRRPLLTWEGVGRFRGDARELGGGETRGRRESTAETGSVRQVALGELPSGCLARQWDNRGRTVGVIADGHSAETKAVTGVGPNR